MTVIPTVIIVLSTVTRGLIKGLLELEIRGRVETIRTAEILRRLQETCYYSNFSENHQLTLV